MNDSELAVKHLWNSSSKISKPNRLYSLIKSDMLTHGLKRCEFRFKFNLKSFNANVRCSGCSVEWSANNYSIKFSKVKKMNKKVRRKYRQIAENSDGPRPEKEILKAKQKLFGKTLLIKCFICNKTTKSIIMQKSSKKSSENLDTINKSTLDSSTISSYKNKKPYQDYSTFIKKKHLEKTCLRTPNMKAESYYLTPNAKATKQLSLTPESTPVLNAKAKRKRDKFAGLLKDACVSSSPKNNNPLLLFLKKT